MGYHTREFKRGVYGEFSKVEEEWEELLDARKQFARVLELCEIADLYGALAGYVEQNFPGMDMGDIVQMAEMTRSAFEKGERVSNDEDEEKDEEIVIGCGQVQVKTRGKPIRIDNR